MNYWINFFNNLYFSQSPLINALIIFFLGLFLSFWVKKICSAFLKKIHFHNALERIRFSQWFNQTELNLKVIKIINLLIQAFIILFFLMISLEILQLNVFSNLVTNIILYYPNIFISIIIFIVSIFAIDFSQKIVLGTQKSNTITYSRYFTKAIDWSIRILMLLAILYQLQIIPKLITIIFIGVVMALSLAVGISLGLAAKKPMIRFLKEIKDTFKFF